MLFCWFCHVAAHILTGQMFTVHIKLYAFLSFLVLAYFDEYMDRVVCSAVLLNNSTHFIIEFCGLNTSNDSEKDIS